MVTCEVGEYMLYDGSNWEPAIIVRRNGVTKFVIMKDGNTWYNVYNVRVSAQTSIVMLGKVGD